MSVPAHSMSASPPVNRPVNRQLGSRLIFTGPGRAGGSPTGEGRVGQCRVGQGRGRQTGS